MRQMKFPSCELPLATLLVLVVISADLNAAEPVAGRDEPPAVVALDPVVVEGAREATGNGPSKQSVEGVFGDQRKLVDVPRSVTAIGADLIDRAAIVELRDLQRLVPNSYGANTFGASSLPTLRGQFGELYQDGLRRQGGNNGLGLPLSFNSIEQIDVIKGPPPVAFGSSQRVGGFINLAPKRPDLDTSRADIQVQAGSWDRYRQSLDWSQPIKAGQSAVRLSAENRNEGSYYDFVNYRSQSLFTAYRLKPDRDSQLDVGVEYFNVDFADNAGFNRPTQQLIDDGLYITGQGVQADGSTVPAAGSVVSPTGLTRISRRRVFTDPDDRNSAETVIGNLRYERTLDEGFRWVTRALYQHLEREEIARNSFVEIIDGADTFNLRSELSLDTEFPLAAFAAAQTTTFGVEYRFHDILGYSQFTTEADNPIDLTGPIENRRIPLSAAQQARLVELRPGLFVSPGAQYDVDGDGSGDFNTSDTTDSTSHQTGVFVQHSIRPNAAWELLLGARGDWFDVDAGDGAPPPGVTAARDGINRWLKAGNAALLFKPQTDITLFATANYSESTSNSLGGGFVLGAGNEIARENFATESRLYEAGIKWAPANGAWYADLSLFDQTRSLRNRDGSNSGIQTHGAESRIAWTPDRHWFLQVAGSWIDVSFDDSVAFQDSSNVLDAFDDSRPDLVAGTGVGSPSFAVFPASSNRVPGIPRVQASGLLSHETAFGLGVAINALYTSEFPLDYQQTVKIREQITVNASVHWDVKAIATDFRFDVFNLTNEDNFSPVFEGGFFGSTLVFPEQPINVLFSIRHRFSL